MARAKIPLLFLALLLAAAPAARPQEAPAADAAKPARATLAGKKSKATLAPASQAWWLGTVVMILALGGAGAICVAAKRQCASTATVRLQVVGRVALPPKHAVFAVKAGGRTLLIGAGPQGAPTLLGELDDEPPPEPAAPGPHRTPLAQSRFDVRIGEDS